MDTALELKHVIVSDPSLEGMVAYRRGTFMKQSAAITYVDYMDMYNFWRQQESIGGVFPSVEMNITNGTGFAFNTGTSALNTGTSAYECKVTSKT